MTATNTIGRQVVVPLTNKSGGSVAAGDVVYLNDGATADSFTTGTTANYTKGVGIAQQTIANNGVGLVLTAGYAALVNVNASVTIGHFGATYSVAKQATDAGATRAAGTFCQFQTGGTTPDAIIWQPDLGGGSGMTNPMTTTGDTIYSSDNSGTPARRGIGSTGQISAVSSGIPAWMTPNLVGWASTTPALASSVVRPELGDYNGGSPTTIDLSGGTAGTGVTYTDLGDGFHQVTYTGTGFNLLDVANAIGTGDFDVRMRVLAAEWTDVTTAGSAGIPPVGIAVTDSSRSAATRVAVECWLAMRDNNRPGIQMVLNTTLVGQLLDVSVMVPPILRIARSGTTITGYASLTSGKTWIVLGTTTASTDFQKIAATGRTITSGTARLVYDWVKKF